MIGLIVHPVILSFRLVTDEKIPVVWLKPYTNSNKIVGLIVQPVFLSFGLVTDEKNKLSH